jgi:hypothetical protein
MHCKFMKNQMAGFRPGGGMEHTPQTHCAQGSERKSISLPRLASLYVVVHGFRPSLAAFGLKLDPKCREARVAL